MSQNDSFTDISSCTGLILVKPSLLESLDFCRLTGYAHESFDSWLTNWVKMTHLLICRVLLGQFRSNQVCWNLWTSVELLDLLLSTLTHGSLIESKWLIYWYLEFYSANFSQTKLLGIFWLLWSCWIYFWVIWLMTHNLSQNDSSTDIPSCTWPILVKPSLLLSLGFCCLLSFAFKLFYLWLIN